MANKRTKKMQSLTINGVDAGGAMTARVNFGYDEILKSDPDGLGLPVKDRFTEFVRGQVVTQDWSKAIDIITAAVDDLEFFEKESGKATFTKYTIKKPVVHTLAISFTKGQYATITLDFECKPADATEGFADMFVPLAAQVAPDYIAAARGGYRITSLKHGATVISHITGFAFNLQLPLTIENNDDDTGYTVCETETDGMTAGGNIGHQDSSIATGLVLAQQLLAAARANLEVTVKQGSGATAKIITIAGVEFDTGDQNSDASAPFTGHNLNFDCSNDPDTPLTLAGTNKLITIANVTPPA